MVVENRRPIDSIRDDEMREQIKELQEGAMGNPILLDAAPTAGTPLLEDYTWGKYSNDLYYRIGNTIYKVSTDDQITIT